MLDLINVSKTYKKGKILIPVLKKINLKLKKKEFLILLGPSGSGKTSLLNIIGGLDKPSSGSVIVDKMDLAKMSEEKLSKWRNTSVSFVFQEYNLLQALTALENVELPLLLMNMSKKERKEHAMSALKIVGLSDRVNHIPQELSAGQEQRAAIARALVTDPELILLDEPTGNLDEATANIIFDLLLKLKEGFGKTLIMVTHNHIFGKRDSSINVKYLKGGILQ